MPKYIDVTKKSKKDEKDDLDSRFTLCIDMFDKKQITCQMLGTYLQSQILLQKFSNGQCM